MLQWIANLIGLAGSRTKKESGLPCVYSVAEDGVRVDVLERLLPCGHCAYSVQAEFFVEELAEWIPIADLRDYNVQTAIKLLDRGAKFVASLEEHAFSPR